MEKYEEDKITALSPKLIELIDCNVVLISQLRATKTIGLADECHLMAITNRLERSKALLNILCTRKNGYNFLVEGLRNACQTGALDILNEPIDGALTDNETDSFPFRYFAQMQISSAKSNCLEKNSLKNVPIKTTEMNDSSEVHTVRLTGDQVSGTEVTAYAVGDIVEVINDLASVRELQKGHGEWIDAMKEILGKTGRIVKVYKDTDVRVSIGPSVWTMNPLAVRLFPYEKLESNNSIIAHTSH